MKTNKTRELIITFKNAHDAIAAEQALLSACIAARVMPLPGYIAAGCGICLRVREGELAAAKAALEAAGIALSGVHDMLYMRGM